MATRTEEQAAIAVAEGSVVWVGGYGVRGRLLFRERDVVFHTVFLGKAVSFLCHLLTEEIHVLVADGKVDMSLAVAGSVQCTFYQMLFHGSAGTFGIFVEQ